MEFRIADTEHLLKNYKPYHTSVEMINKQKQDFATKIESIKDEMETIVNASQKLVLDDATQQKRVERFRELQTEAVELESNFRQDIVEMQNTELEKNFADISQLIKEWSIENNVEYVFNKVQFAYASDGADCTDEIIEFMKTKQVYQEYTETDLVFEIQN